MSTRSGSTEEILLSFVIPTRNEAAGIEQLLERLAATTQFPVEVVFVDDSDDTTAYRVRRLAERGGWGHIDIQLVHRTNRRREGGLGSAVCEGIRRARGTYVCVIDADLQHPPELVEELLARAVEADVDVVVASRYAAGGSDRGLAPSRRFVSRSCAAAAKVLFAKRLRGVTDPLSGFFLLRTAAIDPSALHPHGFKILLEILGRNPGLRIAEVGYEFSERYAGLSKASVREGLRYFWQLGHIRASRPARRTSLHHYDVHGIVTVTADAKLPELERFRVRSLDAPPTVRVRLKRFDRRDPGELIDLQQATPRARYDEVLSHRGFVAEVEVGDTVDAWVSPLVLRSPHVLYTNVVEPILRWSFVRRGYALVHAACFTDGDVAHLVTARTDTGKTTTMLKVLEKGDYGFVSDDLLLIRADGTVLTYPKPLTISHHTVHALTSAELGPIERFFLPLQSRLHSRGGREFAFLLASKGLPVATINAVTQIVVPPPKYHVDRLVPGVPTPRTARVGTLHIIQRGDDFDATIGTAEAVELLLENCEDAYGFPPYSSLEALLLAASDDDLRAQEQDIIRSALRDTPARVLASSCMDWAERIHEHLVGTISGNGVAATSPRPESGSAVNHTA
ncbi:MAG: glycosyltransferase [Acidimicrobiia bacterium]|nr:glycosyltransferase [Acidimicrobiia bacterium]